MLSRPASFTYLSIQDTVIRTNFAAPAVRRMATAIRLTPESFVLVSGNIPVLSFLQEYGTNDHRDE